jgi:peptide/nickel transport system permease protein
MSMKTLSGVVALDPPENLKTNGHPSYRWVLRYGGGVVAGLLLALILLGVLFAGQVTPHNPTGGMDLLNRFKPPFWEAGGSLDHLLGTDNLGRDVLTRTLYGGRVSLQVALIAGTLSTVCGILFGLIGGYFGGPLDRAMVLITNIWVSFPFLVLALAVIAAVGASTTVLIVLLSLAGWVYPARVTRAQTLKIRQLDFVDAAVATGATAPHIIRCHILPNVISINIVLWTFSVGTLIMIEGSLSFLGLGVSPPTPSWGNMLSDGRTYLQDAWWLSVFPGLALMLTVLCVNSVGDSLQKMSYQRILN